MTESDSEPANRLRGLTKRYEVGADAVLAVDDLDLVVERGEIFDFLGRTGAGKSTTIDMVLDYARPTSGSATVLGMTHGSRPNGSASGSACSRRDSVSTTGLQGRFVVVVLFAWGSVPC